MINNIMIIGSGWLGLPLATHLSLQGFKVTATTTTKDKVSNVDNKGNKHLSVVYYDTNNTSINNFKSLQVDLMIITIPPQRSHPDYFKRLTSLHQLALSMNATHLLFISSTSVWGECKDTVNENTLMTPSTDSAKAMVKFEALILNTPHYQASALKLAGLIGGSRHPGRFLAGKQNIKMAKAAVNMVTQRDVIGIISALIKTNTWQQSLIACAPSHPTRDEFYISAANKLSLAPPTFTHDDNDIAVHQKVIDGSLTAQQLNYHYQDDHLMEWLSHSSPLHH